jgi:hypothetical protein
VSERDRKLRLVHSQPAPDAPAGEPPPLREDLPADEPPFTADELREAERIRDAIEAGDEPVSSSLRAAHQPSSLTDADHEALLARVLGDPLAAPTRVEQAAAERLRAALGDDAAVAPSPSPSPSKASPVTGAGASAAEAARMAEMLRAAWRPAELPPLRNEALIARALAGAGKRRRRGEMAAAVVGVLALAAGVALMMVQRGEPGGAGPRAPGGGAPVALIPARSTMHLFDASTPFPRSGEETSRIDRITAARAADLRANRYAQWGVR